MMKPVILLVEDNIEILDFIESNLDDEYSILKTINGELALNILRNEVVDLIVSEVLVVL